MTSTSKTSYAGFPRAIGIIVLFVFVLSLWFGYASYSIQRHTTVMPIDPAQTGNVTANRNEPNFRCICFLFSAAHLHSTVPNTSLHIRYSIDFRTVHLDDVLNRIGAANVDSACTGTTMYNYLRGTDLSHLPVEATAMYDDSTLAQSK